ncbi:PD-(D/E)XK nuclease family protein [Treponema endosymbiont of Eucomonympha sp.]|uniref:PD-(D/E)XK nuclease family protein n=1 Tax=Treponema endosymbiont of Eucomonympha sp. TaxID=1580831 RepID=UPI0007514224|nr:PD-(D/E)XK nuclease family protein [Treponema endosymbiont of Eucomonympha sp.]
MLEFLEKVSKPIKNYRNKYTYKSVFKEISDYFYRENYHSDILAYYLQFEVVKKYFFEWINKNIENKIIFEEYNNGEIVREQDRIDILLYNNYQDRAIIIENKSNNANDQFNQLFRYYKVLSNRKIKVDAIFLFE